MGQSMRYLGRSGRGAPDMTAEADIATVQRSGGAPGAEPGA
jgi:hypothetical protein